MKSLFIFFILILGVQLYGQNSFDKVLKTFVDEQGNVDYRSLLENREQLNSAIDFLKKNAPKETWSSDKEKAYWINVYNAFTLNLILDHYPIKSITDIYINGKTAWKLKLIRIGTETYTLDDIEHKILRGKFKDPRIHVGVNCASISCPKLANFAFTEENIEVSLERLMSDFINDPEKNILTKRKLKLSKIFSWFKEDFTRQGTLTNYIQSYSIQEIDKKARISYLNYNWKLNEK